MAMPASGLGRDIVFRLRLQTDAKEFDALKKLADETDKARKKMADNEAKRAKAAEDTHEKDVRRKKTREEQLEKWRGDVRLKSARLEQRINEQLERERKASETRVANWKERIVRNSAKLEHQESLRTIREIEREKVASIRRVEAEQRQSALRVSMYGRGAKRLLGGATSLGSAVAYSGLIGETNSQTVLNTVLGVQTAREAVAGGVDLWEGYRDVRGAMGGARDAAGLAGTAAGAARFGMAGRGVLALPAAGVVGAGIGAVLATIAAGVSAYGTAGDIRKYGFMGGAAPGSWREKVAQYGSGAAASAFGYLPESLSPLAHIAGGNIGGGVAGLASSNRALSRAEARRAGYMSDDAVESRAANAGQLTSVLNALSASRIASGRGSLSGAYSALRGNVGDWRQLQGMPGTDDEQVRALDRIKQAHQIVLDLQRQQHAEGVAGAVDRLRYAERELSTARETLAARQAEAKGARDLVRGDLFRYGTASRAEQLAVQRIAAKRRTGAGLTTDEIGVASGYSEFRGVAESSAVTKAKAAGADWVFSTGMADAKRLEDAARSAATSVSRAEVTTKNRVEIIHKMERDGSWEDVAIEGFKNEILPLIEGMNKDTEGKLMDALKRALTERERARGALTK